MPDLPIEIRAAEVNRNTADDEARTIEVIWTTGARVLRRRFFDKDFEEELVVSPDAVRLARLNNGAPVLNAHGAWDLADQIGVVERAWLEGGRGHAVLRFSTRPEVDGIWADIRAGVIRNVSVGYATHKREITERTEGPDLHRIIDWEPMEISMVPIPADAGAQTRAETRTYPCELERASAHNGEVSMKDTDTATGGQPGTENEVRAAAPAPAASPAPPAPDASRAAEEARVAERRRIADIRQAVRDFGFAEGDADAFIDSGEDIHEVRAAMQRRLAARNREATPGRSTPSIQPGGQDERETRVRLMSNALANRLDPSIQLEEGARPYRGLRLAGLARECLEAEGVRTRGMTDWEVSDLALAAGGNRLALRMGGLHTTSDFPIILGTEINRRLRASYDKAPRTYRRIAGRATAPDFRALYRVQAGDNPRLLKVNEHGEFKRGTIGEASEHYQLETFGRIIGVTRQVLVNDALDVFSRIPTSWGVAAAALENEIVWGIVTGNPTMSDGQPLFHASHGNLAGSGTAISVDSIGAARHAMRQHRSIAPGSKRPEQGYLISIDARILAIPSALETKALVFTSDMIVPATENAVNPYRRSVEPLVEPLLDVASATAWYLFADPATGNYAIEYAYLDGQEGVYTDTRIGFDVDGVEWKARLDFGAGAVEPKAAYKNPGA